MAEENKKKIGRPKKTPSEKDAVVNESGPERLEMEQQISKVTLENLTSQWANFYKKYEDYSNIVYSKEYKDGIGATMSKWNKLNPFLQNQRIKALFTQPGMYSKAELASFLANPGNSEAQLRAAGWANSATQPIYNTILRRSSDIPLYKYFIIPENLESSEYKKSDFKKENTFVDDWLNLFDVRGTLKTIALQVKREGKSSYLFRNKIKDNKEPVYTTLQKLPTEWVKISGIGQLGYTVSFNMMYFMNIANSPDFFGDFIVKAWADLTNSGVFTKDENNAYHFHVEKARDYKFSYKGTDYYPMIEGLKRNMYAFWLKMPYDTCFTFGSDNSHSWVAPDTMGSLQKLQELTDYGTLAGLIASTPLTAVLTGEAEYIDGARAGKNETKISPELLRNLQDLFNVTTSTNVEAMFFPLKNIKLQQLSSDVNASEIISSATENFVETVGEGGLTITTNKPNVSQIKTAQLLAASKEEYVTLQFNRVLNFILKHKLGLKYKWKIQLWGDIFSFENEKKYLKEIVASGNIALLPKLMSADGLSMTDTKAICNYLKELDFYKEFKTYTTEVNQENAINNSTNPVGRPPMDESDVENDATAASKESGTNTVENRDTLSKKCPICGAELFDDQLVCDDCAQLIHDEYEDK